MILTPSIVVVWLLGVALAVNLGLFEGGSGLGWLHAKLLIVLLLSGYHGWAVAYSKKLAKGQGGIRAAAAHAWRVARAGGNLIVILAVVKPF